VESVKPGSPADGLISTGELISYIVDERKVADKKTYKKAGMCISKPYPITMRPHITAKMHISFFDSDLENLW